MSTEIREIFGFDDTIDQKAAEFLAKAIREASGKDFDYVKYRTSLYAMRGLNLDEATAFKSAFAAAKSMGVSKEALIESAGKYLNVLLREKTQFDDALSNQVNERVNAKHDEVIRLQQRIDELKRKVQEYEQKINEYQQKIDAADGDVEAARQKIDQTKQRFESAFRAFVDLINADLNRIQQYL